MARFARQAQFDPSIRELTERIVKGIFAHDYLSEYMAILCWVRTHIRYVRDPVTLEQVKTPRIVIETETGDCDDLSTLIAAMVGTIGGKSRFVAGAFGIAKPLSHVWVEVWDPVSKAWVILDPVPGRKVGEMVGKLQRTKVVMAVE